MSATLLSTQSLVNLRLGVKVHTQFFFLLSIQHTSKHKTSSPPLQAVILSITFSEHTYHLTWSTRQYTFCLSTMHFSLFFFLSRSPFRNTNHIQIYEAGNHTNPENFNFEYLMFNIRISVCKKQHKSSSITTRHIPRPPDYSQESR